jgi:cytochrome c-type biogenesis protein CcmH/NrfF
MVDNLVALSGVTVTSTNVVLWVVAAVLVGIIVVRRKARKAKEQQR